MPSLILLKSPRGVGPRRFPITTDAPAVIGRDEGQCQVVITNDSVSRRHAVILHDGSQFTIEDLGSRNGTFVNHHRTTGPTVIKSEDRIKICDFLFRFYDEASAPTPEVPLDAADSLAADSDDRPQNDATVRSYVDQAGARTFLEAAPAERLRALLDISTALSRTLDLGPLVPQIIKSIFDCFRQADRCFVVLLDDNGQPYEVAARSLRGNDANCTFSRSIVKRCIDSLQSYLTEDASDDPSLNHSASVANFRIRCAMCVPLVSSSGEALGAIQLDSQDLMKRFHDDDLKFLTIIANISSVFVERAEAHAELVAREKERGEVEIARKVQAGFLPNVFPQLEGYEFFAFYSPAQSVGGDYYDFITLPGGRVACVLGDVAGKGVAAALLMAKLSGEVRFALLTQPDLARAVMLLNDQLIVGGIGDRFVTLVAMVLDPREHTVTLVNAGHMNPVKLGDDGIITEAITNAQSGVPLGYAPGMRYSSVTLPLGLGESILVYTDGVTDAEDSDGNRFGVGQLTDAVARLAAGQSVRPAALGGQLVAEVQGHGGGAVQSDDIALVCVGRPLDDGPPPTVKIRLQSQDAGVRP